MVHRAIAVPFSSASLKTRYVAMAVLSRYVVKYQGVP